MDKYKLSVEEESMMDFISNAIIDLLLSPKYDFQFLMAKNIKLESVVIKEDFEFYTGKTVISVIYF